MGFNARGRAVRKHSDKNNIERMVYVYAREQY